MPTAWVEPEVFLTHNGVTIYHAYKDGNMDQRLTHWFTTGEAEDSQSEFDIRDLDCYVNGKDFAEILKEAIEKGEITMG